MIISQKSTVVHPNPIKPSANMKGMQDDSVLKSLFIDMLKSKNEYNESSIQWSDDETVEISNISNMSLHTFLLKAEKMGKDISYTKRTIIEIS